MADFVFGRNSVIEFLENSSDVQKLFIQKKLNHKLIDKIIKLADKNGVEIEYLEKKELDKKTNYSNHQGSVLMIKDYKYSSLEEIIEDAKNKDRDPLIIILDEINDPHNLGAIIRTSEAAGASGVIIPKHRAAHVNHTVHKTSVGATAHIKIAIVTNINNTIEKLKEEGYWIYGADGHTDIEYTDINYSGAVGLVIGNEGKGISRLTKEKCDQLVKIPMYGKTESLNASTSAAILIYGILNSKK